MKKAYTKNIWWALFALLFLFVSIFCFVDGNPAGGIVCLCFGTPALIAYVILTKKAIKEQEKSKQLESIILNAIAETRSEISKKQASVNSQPSASLNKEQEQRKWCFSIERIGETAKEQYKTSISDSYEEQLDWAIYFGFQLYVAICNIRRDAKFATAFWDWYKYFLKTDWRAPSDFEEHLILEFINTRLSTYDNIMSSAISVSEKNQRLQDALVQFIAKDRMGDPFTPKVAILPIDQVFMLTISLTNLYAKTLEETTPQWDYVSCSSFYIQFTDSE